MRATTWMGKTHVEVQDVPDPAILNSRDAIRLPWPRRESPAFAKSAIRAPSGPRGQCEEWRVDGLG
ncbi:MAG: hypothetical protein M3228_07950 [Actinomycetota bacterium]|nr:hypothetical protein [Actinomycetota bacterium]